jgi:hypothetical protein
MARQTFFFAGQLQFQRRVLLEHALVLEPGEPTAQADQPVGLTGDRERLAVLLAIVKQVPLKALDHLGGDLRGAGHAAIVAPADEPRELQPPHLDRVGREVVGFQPLQIAAEQLAERLRITLIAGDRETRIRTHREKLLHGSRGPTTGLW